MAGLALKPLLKIVHLGDQFNPALQGSALSLNKSLLTLYTPVSPEDLLPIKME